MGDQTPVTITPEDRETIIKLESIFMPQARRQREKYFATEPNSTHVRFVHYTSAEAALSIITKKRLWMRNTNCMADYREVQHGYEMYRTLFADDTTKNGFLAALDGCASGAAQEAINVFDQTWMDVRLNTYISAVSEHDKEEDSNGRLSMWRAFGGSKTRVGLIFKVPRILHKVNLNILFSPVAYLRKEAAHKVLIEVIENIHVNQDYLRAIGRQRIVFQVFLMFLAGVICLKHEGFREEREWRVIYTPKRWPSPHMESSTEIIEGVPQIIHKIPLDASVSESLGELELSRIFDRLIIGPTQYPWPIGEAFASALTNAGVTDAHNRIVASEIPIRA